MDATQQHQDRSIARPQHRSTAALQGSDTA